MTLGRVHGSPGLVSAASSRKIAGEYEKRVAGVGEQRRRRWVSTERADFDRVKGDAGRDERKGDQGAESTERVPYQSEMGTTVWEHCGNPNEYLSLF
ncbi:hypothetical protein WAI453_006197 [Rhynchosporium graminicola]